MDVDIVLAFTGSGATGRRLLDLFGPTPTSSAVYLELGGKSPNIVFADAPDLDEAAKIAAFGIFRNSGQVCVAGSRLLVERSIHRPFADKVAAIAAAMTVGDPLDLGSQAGAVTNLDQLEKNLSHVARARDDGAELLTGARASWNRPAATTWPRPCSMVSRRRWRWRGKKCSAPCLASSRSTTRPTRSVSPMTASTGLRPVFGRRNLARAHRMVRALRAGVVHVNTYGGANVAVPLGGRRQSGNGYDKSLHALDKYVDLKTAWIQL